MELTFTSWIVTSLLFIDFFLFIRVDFLFPVCGIAWAYYDKNSGYHLSNVPETMIDIS